MGLLATLVASLEPEPLAPMATPVTLTAGRFGQVEKIYIHTLRDHAVSLPLQRLMVQRTPVARTFELDTGHAPYLGQARRLAALLDRIVRR